MLIINCPTVSYTCHGNDIDMTAERILANFLQASLTI